MRFIARDGRVVVDEAARLPGRGAWLHRDSACLESALARKAFARALRAPVEPHPDTVDLIDTWQRSA